MVIDDMHTRFGRSVRVKLAAKQFIERRLGANDLMAVVHTFGSSANNQEFTSNRRLLLASIDKFMGKKLESITLSRNAEYYRRAGTAAAETRINDPYEQERAYNARQTMSLLQSVAEWFSGVRGRRKSIILISHRMAYLSGNLSTTNFSKAAGLQNVEFVSDLRKVVEAASRANVTIYSLNTLLSVYDGVAGIPPPLPDEWVLSRSDLDPEKSPMTIAQATGGFTRSLDFGGVFERVIGVQMRGKDLLGDCCGIG